MIQCNVLLASSNASSGNQVGSAHSLSQSHQLVSRQGQDAKHQVSHDLGSAFDPEYIAAEFVFESRIAALGHRALVITDRIRRLEFFFRATARIVINQRNMMQASTVVVQHGAAIGACCHDHRSSAYPPTSVPISAGVGAQAAQAWRGRASSCAGRTSFFRGRATVAGASLAISATLLRARRSPAQVWVPRCPRRCAVQEATHA
jgi:hypothetical protein